MSSTRQPARTEQDPGLRVRGESRTSRYVKWSDLKQRVGFEQILTRYNWLRYMDENRRGQLVGPCPIHTDGEPEASSTSFKVTPSCKGFKCWSCGAKGSIIDFVAGIENVSPTHAGRLINEWFPGEPVVSIEQEVSRPEQTTKREMGLIVRRLERQLGEPNQGVVGLFYNDYEGESQFLGSIPVSMTSIAADTIFGDVVGKVALVLGATKVVLVDYQDRDEPLPPTKESLNSIGLTRNLLGAVGAEIIGICSVSRAGVTPLSVGGHQAT